MTPRNPSRQPSISAASRRVLPTLLTRGLAWTLFSSRSPTNEDEGPPEIVGVDALRCPAGHHNLPGAEFCTTCGVALDPKNPVQYREPTPTMDQAITRLAPVILFGVAGVPLLAEDENRTPPEIVGVDALRCPRGHANVPGAQVCSTCGLPLSAPA